MSLEINCAENTHIIKESENLLLRRRKRRYKGIITDSQQTFQVNALAKQNNGCPWDGNENKKKKQQKNQPTKQQQQQQKKKPTQKPKHGSGVNICSW